MSNVIVSPSGLSILLIRFRSLTAPALVVSASGLIPRRTAPIGAAALVVSSLGEAVNFWTAIKSV